ncbi:hypothetical protein ACFTAO_30685 [Paenibacillus rhizoplanae]
MLGIIRVITLQESSAIQLHGDLIERRYGLPVISRCIPDQPRGVYDAQTEAESIPKKLSRLPGNWSSRGVRQSASAVLLTRRWRRRGRRWGFLFWGRAPAQP